MYVKEFSFLKSNKSALKPKRLERAEKPLAKLKIPATQNKILAY